MGPSLPLRLARRYGGRPPVGADADDPSIVIMTHRRNCTVLISPRPVVR
jgi:hypothetical protein